MEHLPPGYEMFQPWRGEASGEMRSTGAQHDGTEFLVGRLFPGTTALDRIDLADEICAIAADMQPLIDQFYAAATIGAPDSSDEEAVAVPDALDGDLAHLVDEFKASRVGSTKDEQAKADRAVFAEYLTTDELEIADQAVLRQIINTGRYGSPGPQSILNASINSLDVDGLTRFYQTIDDLLWGGEPVQQRIDAALDPEHGIKGLGESVILKLLSIAHPEQFLPVFPYRGEMGKAKLMQLIGLKPPAAAKSAGKKQVEANDAIRTVLGPLLPDPWLQGQFLYWLKGRGELKVEEETEGDSLGALAAELFLPEESLSEIVELLRDKKQIIFYGPPGTGKTYVAQQLARLLAGDPTRHRLVQFHPSTSYEDFFEGYRPETGPEGRLSYRLVEGPLARLAAQASESPGVEHVMVIDEINRANLPKVLGELLFLLEYRNEQVQTLYRPDDAFELPGNLLFIGTMNTADKSIALIDAALRRRFHFVPFFPHEEPHSSVLAKWLAEHNPDADWVAGLLEHVNARLIDVLGGPHLQVGASHFFSKDLDEVAVERIWRFSILPFIEDQLFGQHELIRSFEFSKCLAAYQSASGAIAGDEFEADGEGPQVEPAATTPT